MRKTYLQFFLVSLMIVSLSYIVSADFEAVRDFYGYVSFHGNITPTGAVVEFYIDNTLVKNTTVGQGVSVPNNFYLAHVPGTAGETVYITIWGVNISEGNLTFPSNSTGFDINISTNSTADSTKCRYPTGCTGGYCTSNLCASSAPTTPSTPSGGGPGGGGGGVVAVGVVTTNLDEEVGFATTTGASVDIGQKDKVSFTGSGGKTTKIEVSNVYDDRVTLTLGSGAQVTLYVGKTAEVDSDGDGIKDVSVTLESIEGAVAKLTFKRIAEVAAPEEEVEEEIEEEEIPEELPEIIEEPVSYVGWIVVAIIIVVGIIIAISSKAKKKK